MQHQQSTADGYVMVCRYVFKGGIPQLFQYKIIILFSNKSMDGFLGGQNKKKTEFKKMI